jgi:hypothetical protein
MDILIATAVYADEYRQSMNRGEIQYRKQEYQTSADLLQTAEVVRPDDPVATFQQGGRFI